MLSVVELASAGVALEPELTGLLARGQTILDRRLTTWSSRGAHVSQLFAGHALAHAAGSLRCARPMIAGGHVVPVAVVLRTILEDLLLSWHFAAEPDSVEAWVNGAGPSTDQMWLEAHRLITAARTHWRELSAVRELLNALTHATPLALAWMAESQSERETFSRSIRRGVALAAPITGLCVGMASVSFGKGPAVRQEGEAYLLEAVSCADRIFEEPDVMPR